MAFASATLILWARIARCRQRTDYYQDWFHSEERDRPHPILWNSPVIPVDDDETLWSIRERVGQLFETDAPSRSDLRTVFDRYNGGSAAERDAIDAALVWLTGYTLATISAMVEVGPGGNCEALLKIRRRRGGQQI